MLRPFIVFICDDDIASLIIPSFNPRYLKYKQIIKKSTLWYLDFELLRVLLI